MDARIIRDRIRDLKDTDKLITFPIGLGYATVYWDCGRFVMDHGFCEVQFSKAYAMDEVYLYLGMGENRTCIDCRMIRREKVSEGTRDDQKPYRRLV